MPQAAQSASNTSIDASTTSYTCTEAIGHLDEPFYKLRPSDSAASATASTSKPGSIQLHAVNHIAMEALDVEKVSVFYVDVLGFRRLPRPSFRFGGAWLEGPGVTLHVIAADPTVPGAPTQPEDSFAGAPLEPWYIRRGRHIAFEIADSAAAEAVLQAHGVPYDVFIIPGHPTYKQIFLMDPEGHGVELGVGAQYAHVKEELLGKPAAHA